MDYKDDFLGFKVRPFKWDDLYSLLALINIVTEDEQHIYELDDLYSMLNQSEITPEKTCFLAITDMNRLIGFSYVCLNKASLQYDVYAGVHPEYTDKGVGMALISVNDFNLLVVQSPEMPIIVNRHISSRNRRAYRLLIHKIYDMIHHDEDVQLWQKRLYINQNR